MAGEGSRYYPYLPGVRAHLIDGNYYSNTVTRADPIAMIGTAQDGPLYWPNYLHRADSGSLTYGNVTKGDYNVLKGLAQLSASGADNVVAARITGRYSETILLESTSATVMDLDVDDDEAVGHDYKLDALFVPETNTQTVFVLTSQDTQVEWLATVEIDPSSTAVIDNGTETIPASQWVEGQEYWINYHSGYIEFAYPPIDDGLDTTSDNGSIILNGSYWPYSIRLKSLYPGSKYNTYYNGIQSTATMLVTTSIADGAGTVTITRPDSMGLGSLSITVTADDTNFDVADAINSLKTNTFVKAYVNVVGQRRKIHSLVSNTTAPYTNDSVVETSPTYSGTSPYTARFFSTTFDAAVPTITTGSERIWNQAKTYRRFHYGDDEEFHLANIPGVTGLPAPVSNGDAVISAEGGDISRDWGGTTPDYVTLPYYYAYHIEDNFVQDIYNSLLYNGTAYIECRPNSSGNCYDTSGNPTNVYYRGLKTDYGAFDYIERASVAWLVPKNMWIDNKVFNYSSTSPYYQETTFANLFSEFALTMWENGSFCMISMAYKPLGKTELADIDQYVGDAVNHFANLAFDAISGITGASIDAGRFIVASVGPEVMVRMATLGRTFTTNEALVAGTIAALPAHTAPTNRPLRGALGLKFDFTNTQLNQLVQNHLLCCKVAPDQQIKIVSGVTGAANISAIQPSDYTRIRTMRIVREAVNVVKLAGEPWIGEGNSIEMRAALKTAVVERLKTMISDTSLSGFKVDIATVNTGYYLDNLNIYLELNVPGEIGQITVNVSVKQ